MPVPTLDRTRTLLAINAYYHSDHSSGFVVLLEGDNLPMFANFITEQIADLKRDSVTRENVKQFLDYASDPAKRANTPEMESDAAKLMSAAAIGYLEEIGVIPSDEYNGLQYIYEPRVETTYGHVDGPMPGLEMYRDLPRRPGNFYFALAWTDLNGQFDERKIVRQMSAANMQDAHSQFQEFLDDQHKEECERGTQIDKEEFIIGMIPVAAKRAIELLAEAKSEEDFRLDAPAGRFACFLACWIVWQSPYQHQITDPSLLTLAFHIRFRDDGQFEPIVLADHGEGSKSITLH